MPTSSMFFWHSCHVLHTKECFAICSNTHTLLCLQSMKNSLALTWWILLILKQIKYVVQGNAWHSKHCVTVICSPPSSCVEGWNFPIQALSQPLKSAGVAAEQPQTVCKRGTSPCSNTTLLTETLKLEFCIIFMCHEISWYFFPSHYLKIQKPFSAYRLYKNRW